MKELLWIIAAVVIFWIIYYAEISKWNNYQFYSNNELDASQIALLLSD